MNAPARVVRLRADAQVRMACEDNLDFMRRLARKSVKLLITPPPLNIILYHIFKDHGLQLRNRVIWHFEHGLHCSKRLSGRHETILWFTKSNDYTFHLDPIRIPSKYPNKKYFKGPKVGQLSGNPLGKNPGDVWIFPNVKNNHVEKTIHPCQFPIELVERLVLSRQN